MKSKIPFHSIKSLLFKKNADPQYLIFFVTTKCDSRCHHCFFWRKTGVEVNELTLDEIEKISASMKPFLQLTLTGGDAALREDLSDIAYIFYRNNRIKNITIGTNGNRPEMVESHVKRMLSECSEAAVTVDLSMDGLGEDHDHIRNTPDIFERVEETFHRMTGLKKQYSNLNTCIDITVSAFNQNKLLPLYHHIRDDLKPDIINAILIRGTPRNPEAKKVYVKNYEDLNSMLKEDYSSGLIRGYSFFTDILNVKDFLLRQIIINIHKQDRYIVPCTAGSLTAVVYPEGEVFPCELLDDCLGSLREADLNFREIWFSERAREIRKNIVEKKCYCIHQCFLSNNILFNPALFPKFLYEYLKLKVTRSKKNPNR